VTALDREIMRLFMYQVREEQAARVALTRALLREEAAEVPIPTDAELDARINELKEVAKQRLDKERK
jgi:hypothetical protein